ncbi:MAG: PepSY domain-containing protein [Limnohabitans sp.]
MTTLRLPVFCLAAVLAWPLAHADSDQDRARAAVQAGQVLPLKAVLEGLERDHPGQVLEVELEREHGRWIYEIKLLQASGRLVRLEVDAASGAVLQRRERGRDGHPRPH